jgi:hypothetical protein
VYRIRHPYRRPIAVAKEAVSGRAPVEREAPPPAIHGGVIHAFSSSLDTVFLWAAALVVIGFLVSWLLREIPLREYAHVGGEAEGLPELLGETAGEQ